MLVPVYHGSTNNAANIRAYGLSPFNLPVFVSRDQAAAEDAIAKSLSTDPTNSGIIESDIPTAIFLLLYAPYERPYKGFFPYSLTSTEIPLRTPIQVEVFNKYKLP